MFNNFLFKKFPFDPQMDMMDCGPSCLRMIARYYGKYYTLQFLREKCFSSKEGVSFSDLSQASEAIGLSTLAVENQL
ncbi:cysteine peptidase family C39 domain-containing protein [Mucilaginibacter kameinonensis]|uniref:cysteine peptidase family C39 domain-containing protein n=1 Tax=Mucilaginibacter kameinonensis TaxID=452286 RepID=UPI000EF7E966|nr:cysteine peptidase family C39 domain-containing protein [Mucilaginibacter kameinonensis]